MFPWATVISLAGQAASGIFSKINNDKMQSEQEAESARQQAYYNTKANENPLARSENKQVLNQYDRKAQQQVENARNVAKITGATPEYSLAVQKGVTQGRADLMGNIAANASAQRDKYEQAAEDARHERSTNEIARRNERNTTFANLAGNAANAFSSIMSGYAGGKTEPTAADYQKQLADLDAGLKAGAITQEQYDAQSAPIRESWGKLLTGGAA